jgi:hypothetical protein
MWITGTENRLGRIRLATISIVVPDLKLRQKDPDLTALVRQSASRIETRLGCVAARGKRRAAARRRPFVCGLFILAGVHYVFGVARGRVLSILRASVTPRP